MNATFLGTSGVRIIFSKGGKHEYTDLNYYDSEGDIFLHTKFTFDVEADLVIIRSSPGSPFSQSPRNVMVAAFAANIVLSVEYFASA